MNPSIDIAGRKIGPEQPVFIVAEMSANHGGSLDHAIQVVREAAKAGADAIKLQTYTENTLTIDADSEYFKIKGHSLWAGQTLYELYKQAHMPWDWQPKLKEVADESGIILFSSPFDRSAVDFLEGIDVPAYKIASFELVDLNLIEDVAKTGKPIVLSTGMASLSEIDEAVRTAREAGARQIALLKCTSAYPAKAEEMNLKTIPHLREAFDLPVGLSDHTLDNTVAIASVALGANIIEKHFTLSRSIPSADSKFSLEPAELNELVKAVRKAEKALGRVQYQMTEEELASRAFRRSLFVTRDVKAGDRFTEENVRSIRPANGLPPKHLRHILGKRSARDIARGTPLTWDMIE